MSLLDLYPTLCGLCGIEAPDDLDGVDLSATVETGREPDRGPVFSDYMASGASEECEFRVVREGRYKYVAFRDASELLFELAVDPFETTNLAPNATGEDTGALERYRDPVEETLDFEEALEKRERDIERKREESRSLANPQGIAGNAYHLFDDRIVDGDNTITKPDVLVQQPAALIEDWPERADETR